MIRLEIWVFTNKTSKVVQYSFRLRVAMTLLTHLEADDALSQYPGYLAW